MEWITQGGYEWGYAETTSPTPVLTLVLGHGPIDEPAQESGSLQRFMGAVRDELSRSIEIGPGRVSAAEVQVHVGSDTVSIAVRGDETTMRAAWKRLAGIFAGSELLEAHAREVAVEQLTTAREVTTRFGLTALSLAQSNITLMRAPDLETLRARLDPAAGLVRCVMYTNTRALIADDFEPPRNTPPAGPAKSRLREQVVPSAAMYPPSQMLCTTVVPRTNDGLTAVRLLVGHLSTQAAMIYPEAKLSASLVPVGPDLLVTVMSASIPGRDVRRQLLDLFLSRTIPDHLLVEEVGPGGGSTSLNVRLDMRVLGLADGVETTAEGARAAVARAWQTMRVVLEPGLNAPEGYAPELAELPAPTGTRFRARGKVERLTIGGSVLESQLFFSKKVPGEIVRIDLESLSLVIDDTSNAIVLVDENFRILGIAPDIYRNERALRAAFDQHAAGVPRVRATGAAEPEPLRTVLKDRRKQRRFWSLLTTGFVLFPIVMSGIDDWIGPAEPSESESAEPRSTGLNFWLGETATLLNGSRVSVDAIDRGAEKTATVSFTYCALESDIFEPSRFFLEVKPAEGPSGPFSVSAAEGAAATLEPGECASTKAAFSSPGLEQSELTVVFQTTGSDRLRWFDPSPPP